MFFRMTALLLATELIAAGIGHLFGNAKLGIIYFDLWMLGVAAFATIVGKSAHMMNGDEGDVNTEDARHSINTSAPNLASQA
jgi:hypothetical protein